MNLAKPQVPPSEPRSTILPFSQRKGSCVGTLGKQNGPLSAFGVEFMYEYPITWPRLLGPTDGAASGPPRVPMSRITPCSHRNVRVCVPKPNKEKGSGTVFAEAPITCPLSLIPVAMLVFPPKVPRSRISSCVQSTARTSGKPVRGSMSPFEDRPVICPRALISAVLLLLTPGSAPRSFSFPFSQRKTCETKQSKLMQFGALGSTIAVSASPVAIPLSLRTLAPGPSADGLLVRPPKVPRSISLYVWCL